MLEKENIESEEIMRKPRRSLYSIPKDLPPIDISDEKVTAFLQYLESSMIRSNILVTCNHEDPSIFSNLLNDRIDDITILSSICQGLLNNNRNLRNKIDELQKYIKLQNEREAEVSEYCKLANIRDEINRLKHEDTSIQPIIPKSPQKKNNLSPEQYVCSELQDICENLDSQNTELITKILNLTSARQNAEEQEQSIVDNIIMELKQKREETSTLTKRVSEQISEYLQHQDDISDFLLSNCDLVNKYSIVTQSKKKLKEKVKHLTDACYNKDAEIEFLVKKNKELEENLFHNFGKQSNVTDKNMNEIDQNLNYQLNDINPCPQSAMNFSKIASIDDIPDTDSRFSKTSDNNSSEYESNPKLLTRKFLDENGIERVQIIKTMQGSEMLKKWKQLGDSTPDHGLNSILQFPKYNDIVKTPKKTETQRSLYSQYTPSTNFKNDLFYKGEDGNKTPKIHVTSAVNDATHKGHSSRSESLLNGQDDDNFNNIPMSEIAPLKKTHISKFGGNLGKTLTQYEITPAINDQQCGDAPSNNKTNIDKSSSTAIPSESSTKFRKFISYFSST